MRVSLFSHIPSSVRILALSAAGALLLLMAIVFTGGQATAQPSLCDGPGSSLVYCNDRPGEENPSGGGSGGADGGGGNEEPPCNLETLQTQWPGASDWFCEGQNACWWNNPPAGMEPSEYPEPPSENAGDYVYKYCVDPNGNIVFQDYTWTNIPDEPPLEEQAQTAFGELNAPPFELAFSPPGESVIYIDTWWWAEGAPSGNLEGSSAFGLVAIAQPDHLEVDPGNGKGTITCDFVTTESDACTYVYERASGDGGYPARARLVYDVTFEENDEPIDIPGAPDTFQSAWEETAVPVVEVQSNVVR
jgi:hypothetical protein